MPHVLTLKIGVSRQGEEIYYGVDKYAQSDEDVETVIDAWRRLIVTFDYFMKDPVLFMASVYVCRADIIRGRMDKPSAVIDLLKKED